MTDLHPEMVFKLHELVTAYHRKQKIVKEDPASGRSIECFYENGLTCLILRGKGVPFNDRVRILCEQTQVNMIAAALLRAEFDEKLHMQSPYRVRR